MNALGGNNFYSNFRQGHTGSTSPDKNSPTTSAHNSVDDDDTAPPTNSYVPPEKLKVPEYIEKYLISKGVDPNGHLDAYLTTNIMKANERDELKKKYNRDCNLI